MRLGGGAVQEMHILGLGLDQGVQEPLPKPTSGPAVEAIVDRGRRAVDRWAILPSTAGAQDMDDTV
jgi:hypothetical protein